MSDPYVYPKTTILKNKLNIKDIKELNIKERGLTASRIEELSRKELPKEFDFEYLKSIHKYIFQDIYEWAGQIRKGDIAKGNSLFCKAIHIESYASDIFKNLKKECYFRGIEDKKILSQKLAEAFSDINALHPFREGNGRTQREFIKSLAKYNGYDLSFTNISKQEMIELSDLASDSKKLAKKFYEGMVKVKDFKKEVEILIIETMKKDISKDNYNVLTGNPITAENHLSGDKRWIAVSDVRKENIAVKELEQPMLSVVLHKEEERLYARPIEYYNVSQLNITKEIEQKFVPMKEKQQEKANDKEIER